MPASPCPPHRPRLSIVVPVLNETARLAGLVAALAPLRARGAEVLLVDGGSTDGSWPQAQALVGGALDAALQAPRGRSHQMNAGAARARAPVLLFLHADTTLPDGADQMVLDALATGATWGRFDVHIASPLRTLRLVEWMMNWRSRATGVATGDQAMFMTRAAFDTAGGFAPVALMEDIALSRALLRQGRPACLHAVVHTAGRRWETRGVWRTVLLMWQLRLAYFLGADPAQLALRYGYQAPEKRVAIAILAKAPVPGLAKTRLIPALGERAAARLQRRLTLRTLHTARKAAVGPVTLWCAPDPQQRFFRALARYGVRCESQPTGDIGVRMLAAARWQAAQPDALPVIVLGTDCPALTPADIEAAARQLQAGMPVVLQPALDGGYVLIGLCTPQPTLFAGVDWSTDRVMAQTRARLATQGLLWWEAPTLWDVDRPDDLPRLRALAAAENWMGPID